MVQRRLDRITGLLSIALDVPIAAVSLIDQHQECFKSVVGALPTEVPIRTSLGSRVVAADGPLVIEDASLDERFCRYPLVSDDPGVRLYAGFPLRDGGGDAFGTLCAADIETRQLSGRHRAVAEHLADWAAVELATAGSERNPMRSEALYHRIVESVSDGMVVLDTAGVIIETNRSAELILGFSADQMAGRESADPCWRAVRPDGSPFPGSAHPGMV
ncbi:MAG: PAS domain S-box protein, partial [Actinomycetia bacterium]|nr:PAS domain S-box protein [Actinomycetes bacterium]